MPILEGALERSVDLAAAMDSRGYGRTTVADPRVRRATSAFVVAGMLGICLGLYGVLTGTPEGWMGLPALVAGVGLGVGGIVLGGRRTERSRYRPDPWALPEWLVVACGAVAAGLMFWQVGNDPTQLVLASPTQVPPVPVVACLGILVAMLPAVLAPPLPEGRSAR
jgi:energy-coupling factor transport system permease protein